MQGAGPAAEWSFLALAAGPVVASLGGCFLHDFVHHPAVGLALETL